MKELLLKAHGSSPRTKISFPCLSGEKFMIYVPYSQTSWDVAYFWGELFCSWTGSGRAAARLSALRSSVLWKTKHAGEENGKECWCWLQPHKQTWFISREEVAAHSSSMESPAVRGLTLTVLYFFMGTTSNPILLIAKPRNFMLWRTIIMPLYMLTYVHVLWYLQLELTEAGCWGLHVMGDQAEHRAAPLSRAARSKCTEHSHSCPSHHIMYGKTRATQHAWGNQSDLVFVQSLQVL